MLKSWLGIGHRTFYLEHLRIPLIIESLKTWARSSSMLTVYTNGDLIVPVTWLFHNWRMVIWKPFEYVAVLFLRKPLVIYSAKVQPLTWSPWEILKRHQICNLMSNPNWFTGEGTREELHFWFGVNIGCSV